MVCELFRKIRYGIEAQCKVVVANASAGWDQLNG
jgi:hypothetical protein